MTNSDDSADVPVVRPEEKPCYKVLVVDDNNLNRDILRSRLEREGCEVREEVNGQDALAILRSDDFDLVLLDMMMPVLDGMGALSAIKADEQLRHIPVLMVSAVQDMEMVAKCISLGADDYLTKPVNPVLLKARIHASLERKRLQDLERRIAGHATGAAYPTGQPGADSSQADVYRESVLALAEMAESRDAAVVGHGRRLRSYCKLVADQLTDLPSCSGELVPGFVSTLLDACPLHDIGKSHIPDSVLLKNGELTADEMNIMRQHVPAGVEVLKRVEKIFPGDPFIVMALQVAETHHERWDGKGYPCGLQGTDIPLPARIVAVCAVYDALTSARCYRPAKSHQDALDILRKERGGYFDPAIVDAFLACEEDVIDIK